MVSVNRGWRGDLGSGIEDCRRQRAWASLSRELQIHNSRVRVDEGGAVASSNGDYNAISTCMLQKTLLGLYQWESVCHVSPPL